MGSSRGSDPAVGQGPGGRAGLVRRAPITKTGATTTTQTYDGADADPVRQDATARRPPSPSLDGKVAVAGDIASVKAAVDTKGNGALRLRAGSEGRARLDRPTTTSGSSTSRSSRCSTGRTMLSKALPSAARSRRLRHQRHARKALPEWAAYCAALRERRPRHRGDAARRPRRASARPRTALDDRRARAGDGARRGDRRTTSGPPLKETLDALPRRRRRSSRSSTRSTRRSASSAAPMPRSAGSATAAIVVNAPDGTPEGGVVVVPTDQAAAEHLFTALRTSSPRWRPGRASPSTTRPTTGRRSRSSTSATSAS